MFWKIKLEPNWYFTHKIRKFSKYYQTYFGQGKIVLDLDREKSSTQTRNIWAAGLKILTPGQILSRLTIYLAQLKAENNSEKLKNEIRQLLHYLYRSKKLTKNIYKNLIDIV